jgi:rhodanese-related sulfurtransferase
MATSLSRLTLNQKLAVAALLLGAVALAAKPYRSATVEVDTTALSAELAKGEGQTEPRELAAWILGGRGDFRVIDVRTPDAFASGQIPGAENIPVGGLLDAGLVRTERIIICGDDGVSSAQAWLLLRAKGYRGASVLKGGMAAWRDQVVSPMLVENPTPEQKQENDKLTAIAAYFGGQPRMPAGATAVPVTAPPVATAAPRIAPPVAAAAAPAKAPAGKKKREGC